MKTQIQGDTEVTEHENYGDLDPAVVASIKWIKDSVMEHAPHGVFAVLQHSSGHFAVSVELNHVDLTIMNMDVAVAVANFRALWEMYLSLPSCMGSQPVAHA